MKNDLEKHGRCPRCGSVGTTKTGHTFDLLLRVGRLRMDCNDCGLVFEERPIDAIGRVKPTT